MACLRISRFFIFTLARDRGRFVISPFILLSTTRQHLMAVAVPFVRQDTSCSHLCLMFSRSSRILVIITRTSFRLF